MKEKIPFYLKSQFQQRPLYLLIFTFVTDVLSHTFDYYSMPVLSELDDFDRCLKNPDAVYCIVDFELLEDDTPLYRYIKVRKKYY